MLDEIITGEEYCSGDPVELQGATYRVIGMKICYGGKVQLHLRRLTQRAVDVVERHAKWCASRNDDMCDCGGWQPPRN